MTIRRRKDSEGRVYWECPGWIMSSLLAGFLLWMTWVTAVTNSNQIALGAGGRFTEADGVRMHARLNHLINRLSRLESSLSECQDNASADRQERSDLRAEFQLFRAELREHADHDDRRFGIWRSEKPEYNDLDDHAD